MEQKFSYRLLLRLDRPYVQWRFCQPKTKNFMNFLAGNGVGLAPCFGASCQKGLA